MKWKKYTIKSTTQAEDFISCMLAELGVEGVEIEDNIPLSAEDKEKMFIDILPGLPPDKGIAYISFYLNADGDQEEILNRVKEELELLRQLTDLGEGTITVGETEDTDWINNWKQYFKSFSIDDIYIKPAWEKPPVEGDYKCIIEIDPGTSFGTGKHETTQLCIRQLQKYVKKNDRILDVGFGSGILSIVGLKLGAGQVTGTDIDPVCMEAFRGNMELNGLPVSKGEIYQGNLIDDIKLQQRVGRECYDIVVANILADVIIPLTPVVRTRLKKDGIYIASGIIDFREEPVKAAMEEAGLRILEICRMGEWVGITARKQEACTSFL